MRKNKKSSPGAIHSFKYINYKRNTLILINQLPTLEDKKRRKQLNKKYEIGNNFKKGKYLQNTKQRYNKQD